MLIIAHCLTVGRDGDRCVLRNRYNWSDCSQECSNHWRELNKDAVKDARINAKENGIKNAEIYAGDAGRFVDICIFISRK